MDTTLAQATETIRVTMGDTPMPKEDCDWVVREFRRILGEAEGWDAPTVRTEELTHETITR